jgi:hypothetical protein
LETYSLERLVHFGFEETVGDQTAFSPADWIEPAQAGLLEVV